MMVSVIAITSFSRRARPIIRAIWYRTSRNWSSDAALSRARHFSNALDCAQAADR
jgi:hypothetical protein